jgi:ribonuclease Z
MASLFLLGTGAAISDPHRTTTMLAVCTEDSTVAIDCGGDLVQRLLQAGIDLDTLEALILTHEHPDHVSGFPLFMEKIWIAGRRRPIPVHGIRPALDVARRIFEAFDTSSWKGMPEIEWHEIPQEEGVTVLDTDAWRITAAPVQHSVPTMGFRIEEKAGGKVVVYSCDTEPSDAVVRLAENADILVHEASGDVKGHTSAEGAAQIAARAGVRDLLLVHLPPDLHPSSLDEARRHFEHVEKGDELGEYGF